MKDKNPMISNERPSPFYRQPYRKPIGQPYQGEQQPYGHLQQPRPQFQEETLKTCDLEVERKSFRLTLKENSRGRFLRVTESNGNKFNSIVVPASGLADFQQMINEMIGAVGQASTGIGSQPMPSQVEDPAPPHVEASTAPEPEPQPLPAKKAKATKSKVSATGKVGRKKAKAAKEAER